HLNLADVLRRQNELDEALAHYNKSIEIMEATGNRFSLPFSFLGLGRIALSQGDLNGACEYLREALTQFTSLNNKQGLGWTLLSFVVLAAMVGPVERAVRLLGQVDRLLY